MLKICDQYTNEDIVLKIFAFFCVFHVASANMRQCLVIYKPTEQHNKLSIYNWALSNKNKLALSVI